MLIHWDDTAANCVQNTLFSLRGNNDTMGSKPENQEQDEAKASEIKQEDNGEDDEEQDDEEGSKDDTADDAEKEEEESSAEEESEEPNSRGPAKPGPTQGTSSTPSGPSTPGQTSATTTAPGAVTPGPAAPGPAAPPGTHPAYAPPYGYPPYPYYPVPGYVAPPSMGLPMPPQPNESLMTSASNPYQYTDVANLHDPIPDTRRNRGGVTEPFPEKLHRMLEWAERENKKDVVSFFSHGRAFAIHKPRKFVKDIMPKFFRQTRLTSFQRQLNLYGFRRLSQGPDNGGYYHELFLKGRPGLCVNMKRTKVKGASKLKRDPDSEPNFYTYPPIKPQKSRRNAPIVPSIIGTGKAAPAPATAPAPYTAMYPSYPYPPYPYPPATYAPYTAAQLPAPAAATASVAMYPYPYYGYPYMYPPPPPPPPAASIPPTTPTTSAPQTSPIKTGGAAATSKAETPQPAKAAGGKPAVTV